MMRLRYALLIALMATAATARPQIDGRIIGGYEAQEKQFPYAAALFLNTTLNTYNFCGGVLISPSYVLTAAHCLLMSQKIEVVLGSTQINITTPEQVRVTLTNESFIIPEEYDKRVYDWDLGLLKLPEPVELSDYIQPIPLPEGNDSYAGEMATVAGWGIQWGAQTMNEDKLRFVENVILSNHECVKHNPTYQAIILDTHICQSTLAYRGACHGDSGGPLVVDDVLVGIVSIGPDNCFLLYPVGFTRITSFRDWIKENAGV